jgi:V/A-type H+-transporting ATPase subunit I
LGESSAVSALASTLVSQKCLPLNIPADLPAQRDAALEWIDARAEALGETIQSASQHLHALSEEHGLALALGQIRQLQWLNEIVPDVGQTQRLAWITGWTNDAEGTLVEHALTESGIQHFIAYPPAPPGSNPPVTLSNPPWSRPFEILTRMLGMPASMDADPSSLVAVIGPLLFGFMFGDVGQGLVLLVTGLVFRRRFPVLGVLVSGGVMSMVFGFLFGSVFAREDLIAPLWFHPLDHPIELLVISVGAGVAILVTGLLLDAVQMHWHGQAGDFWRGHAGLLSAYCGMIAIAFIGWYGVAIMLAGVAWFVAGAGFQGGWQKGATATGEMVEALFQLAVNTLSFARVGAFALAHAGLSIAVISLADAAGPIGYWPTFVLGNAFVIGLEGLVVSIQTTRLVLFEFFIRFVHAGGREFRPLQPPHVNHSGLAEGEQ